MDAEDADHYNKNLLECSLSHMLVFPFSLLQGDTTLLEKNIEMMWTFHIY